MKDIITLDRYQGGLLGLAVGDAVGTTLEFKPPGSFTPIEDMVGGGPFQLEPGEWTDDTSMALCLATSLVEKEGFDPTDQMERYLRWYRQGYLSSTGECFDIGNTVRAALWRFEQTQDPYSGLKSPMTAGNGSIMRLIPVPLFYGLQQPQKAIEQAGESSRTTHGTLAAIDACRYLSALIIGALKGEDKETLLSAHYSPLPNYWEHHPLVPEIYEIAAGSFKVRQPTRLQGISEKIIGKFKGTPVHTPHVPSIKGTGYVVKSLEAALWAFYHSHSFRDGCLLAINLGDDADTTGAVYGQLAGAFYGVQNIPEGWREKLAQRKLLERLAKQLFELAST